jgi:site-specific DNA-cytosine methylase
MMSKGISKPYRFTLVSATSLEIRHRKELHKLVQIPPELYEHLQNFPIGWTHGIPSTARKKALGNAVTVNVIRAIAERLLPKSFPCKEI